MKCIGIHYLTFTFTTFFIVAIINVIAQHITTKTVINKTNFNEDAFPVGTLNCTMLYSNNGIINHSQYDSFEQSQNVYKKWKKAKTVQNDLKFELAT